MKDNPYLPKTCVLGIVMAKQTSVRLTNKNIADICGNPMFSYPIDTLKRSGICRRVIVSTDSQEYADLAMQHNADDAVLEDVTLQSPRWGIMSYVADATRRKYEKRCGIAFTHLAWIGGNTLFALPSWFRVALKIVNEYYYNRLHVGGVLGVVHSALYAVHKDSIHTPNIFHLPHTGLICDVDFPHELEIARHTMQAIKDGIIPYPLDETASELNFEKRWLDSAQYAGLSPKWQYTLNEEWREA